MAGLLRGKSDLVITGVSHRTGSVSLRDRLFIEDHEIESISRDLKARGADGVLVLSTCDRVEIAVTGERTQEASEQVRDLLVQRAQGDDGLMSSLYHLSGEEACRHLFRVASSLESQVIGEPQVLGQVKVAHRLAREAGAMSNAFDAMLQAAYAAAKEVRSETRIGERPVSIAAAAGAVARDVHGDLTSVRGILIGDGDMGMLVAEHLIGRGISDVTVLHDRRIRAESAAARLGCHAADLAALSDMMQDGDIVMCALGRRGYALSSDMVRHALDRRRHRPVLLLDLAVPGDADPSIDRLEDVYLFDLANLDALAADGAQSREAELPAASAIVDRCLTDFVGEGIERDAVPALTRFRTQVETLRDQALREAGGDAEKATHLLANRLLHGPSVALKKLAREGGPDAVAVAEQLLETLFDHQSAQAPDDGDADEH